MTTQLTNQPTNQRTGDNGDGGMLIEHTGRLHLCDLAGSECAKSAVGVYFVSVVLDYKLHEHISR